MFKTLLKILPITIMFSIFIMGCSRNLSNPMEAQNPSLDMPSIDYLTEGENHESLGFYTAKFDLDSMTATVEPNRDMSMRLNVKPYLPNPVITIKSWDPSEQIINVDVKIMNPYNIHGFDLRLIIFTDNIGHTLKNDDGWTSLYDIPGGLPINPFKAYRKEAINRIFPAFSQSIENLNIMLPGMNPNVNFAIDVSTPSNSPEPYQIANFNQNMLPETVGATGYVSFDVFRWNPTSTVSAWMQCSAVFGSNIIQIPTSDGIHFEGEITNYTGAPQGKYTALILSKTNLSPLYLYDMIPILVATQIGNGWAVQHEDQLLKRVAVDKLGNAFCAGSEFCTLTKFNDAPSLEWSRDLKTDENYMFINDLYFNEFLRVGGTYSQCTTNCGYNVSMFSTGNSKYFTSYDCKESLGGASGMSVIGDKAGNTIMASGYGNSFYLKMGINTYSNSLLTKFDANGDIVWNHQFAGIYGRVTFSSIEFAESEMINATGFFMVSAGPAATVDFDPGTGEAIRIANGPSDAFLAQYNVNDGSYSKVVTWGSPPPGSLGYVMVQKMAVDRYDNTFCYGNFSGQIDFDPGTGAVVKNSVAAYGDMYISKLDPDFNFVKMIQLPMVSDSFNFMYGGIASDRAGNIYLVGNFQGTTDFDPGDGVLQKTAIGSYDIFLLKLSNDLEFQWVQTWGSTVEDYGWDVACNQSNGNIYITGSFNGTIDCDPGPGVYNLTPTSGMDSFLMKVLPNGYWE